VYEQCLKNSAKTSVMCAEEWATAKGFLPETQYLALKDAEKEKAFDLAKESPSLIFDLEEGLKSEEVAADELEEGFFASAPEAPVEAFDLGAVESSFAFPEPIIEKVIINTPVKSVVEPAVEVVETLKPAAPVEAVEPVFLTPREPSALDERDYFTCFQVPLYMASNDLWEWLAYKLFFVLVCLIVIIFLLAFLVFLLWRRMNEDGGVSSIKNK